MVSKNCFFHLSFFLKSGQLSWDSSFHVSEPPLSEVLLKRDKSSVNLKPRDSRSVNLVNLVSLMNLSLEPDELVSEFDELALSFVSLPPRSRSFPLGRLARPGRFFLRLFFKIRFVFIAVISIQKKKAVHIYHGEAVEKFREYCWHTQQNVLPARVGRTGAADLSLKDFWRSTMFAIDSKRRPNYWQFSTQSLPTTAELISRRRNSIQIPSMDHTVYSMVHRLYFCHQTGARESHCFCGTKVLFGTLTLSPRWLQHTRGPERSLKYRLVWLSSSSLYCNSG